MRVLIACVIASVLPLAANAARPALRTSDPYAPLNKFWATAESRLGDLKNPLNDIAKKAEEALRKAGGESEERKDMPTMNGIEILRMGMCWTRPNILEHGTCLNWMVRICAEKKSGLGYCLLVVQLMDKACERGDRKMCKKLDKLEQEGGFEEAPKDSDGDGVPDKDDAFPHDPHETMDTDGDGVGDDRDDFPQDPNMIKDSDGDGVDDSKDDFPLDPNEQTDTDGDGVGDNRDAFPNDSLKWAQAKAEPEQTEPEEKEPEEAEPEEKAEGELPPGGEFNKVIRKLPDQGYNEHSDGEVKHGDQKTHTSDWLKEWPMKDETHGESIDKICEKYPNTRWCQAYRRRRAGAAAQRRFFRR